MSKIFGKRKSTNKRQKAESRQKQEEKYYSEFQNVSGRKKFIGRENSIIRIEQQDYMIQMSLNHSVEVFGNIRVFDELKEKLRVLEEYFENVNLDCDMDENKLELLHIFWKCLKR